MQQLQLQPGQVLHQYKMDRLLGSGGIANVYLGYSTENGQPTAIKVLKPEITDKEYAQRFIREARVMMRLNHPNILKVYHFANENDLLYMAMQFVEGGNLADAMAAGKLSLTQIGGLLRQIAAALDYAHSQQVIHRDVKPQNILVDTTGNAYLCDFGMVKPIRDGTNFTSDGTLLGTPEYMAPEQCRAAPCPQTDVYAMGIMLYEMLCGEVPFTGRVPAAVLNKHLYSPIPTLTDCRPNLPPALNAVIEQALAKEPADRYPNAGALVTAFEQAAATSTAKRADQKPLTLPTRPQPAAPVEESASLKTLWLLIGGVVAIAVIFTVIILVFAGG